MPGKNTKDFLGQPLLAWAIGVAKQSGVCDRIIVSTDDEAIAAVAKKYGAEVPFLRPAEYATDTSPVIEAIKYTLDRLKDEDGYQSEWFIVLEPSSPGRQAQHLREVAEIIKQERGNFDSIVGVSKITPQSNATQGPPNFSR